MPISNGYEACKNIVNLYADSTKIFKIHRDQSLNDLINADPRGFDSQKAQFLRFKDLIPVIFALNSSVIDEALMKRLKDHGFDGGYETPIHDSLIKNEIIPRLCERKQLLDKKINIIK